MNNLLADSYLAAKVELANKNPQRFVIGEKVEINGHDFSGAKGIVVGHKTNMLGIPLVMVKIEESELVFYPSELRKIP